MGFYSKNFIDEIANNRLHKTLIAFFDTKKTVYGFTENTIYELVSNVLDEYFEGKTLKEDLITVINSVRKNRTSKRKRWYDTYMTNCEMLSIEDSSHPCYNSISLLKNLPFTQSQAIFGDISPEQFVENDKIAVCEWKNNLSSFMIEFPALHTCGTKNVYKAFKSDIILNIWSYIDNELDGNISFYEKKYPEMFIDKPLFSPNTFSLVMTKTSSGSYHDIVTDDDGNELLEIEVNVGGSEVPVFKSLGPECLKIVESSIAHINMDDFCLNKTSIVDLSVLAKSIVDYKPGMNVYDKVEELCLRLVDYNHKHRRNGKNDISTALNFYQRVDVERYGERPYAMFVFTDTFADAIIHDKLISLTYDSYGLLQNALSKIICYALKREQIATRATGYGEYTYTFFQKTVRFSRKDKAKNIAYLRESLQEFVDNKIIIESFIYEQNRFKVHFLPLTEYELADLKEQQPEFQIESK